MNANFIGILLPTTPNYTVGAGFITALYDAAGAQTITVEAGASLDLRGTLGANIVRLHGPSSEWQIWRDGSTAMLLHASGDRIQLPAQLDAQSLVFADRTLALKIDNSGSQAQVLLGSQVLAVDPASILAEAGGGGATGGTGASAKAAWSLAAGVTSGSKATGYTSGLLLSDGTLAGTSLMPTDRAVGDLKPSPDFTKAVFTIGNGNFVSKVSWMLTDGSTAGTFALATDMTPGTYSDKTLNWGDHVALVPTGFGNGVATAAVTDWTVANTRTGDIAWLPSLGGDPYVSVDQAQPNAWYFTQAGGPYGAELMRLGLTGDGGISASLVKDINPGTASSLAQAGLFSGAVLPDGRFVFKADDGTSGTEPWVSDGTAAGTFRLADLGGSKTGGSNPGQFVTLGEKVVFAANVDRMPNGTSSSLGQELVVTDGTAAGTQVFDVVAGQDGSSPQLLGQSNGQLYFLAADALYRTDGFGYEKLVEWPAPSSVEVVARTDQRVYLKLSSTAQGEELWVGDFAAATLSLVKDMIPGSGSGLATHTPQVRQLVGEKLVFTAYENATDLAMFVTDGTEAGTFRLASGATEQPMPLGNDHLIFSTGEGTHVADLSGASAPQVTTLSSSAVVGSFQKDGDQAFFRTMNGELFSSRGTAETTILLASSVSQFKVVADDAVYFTQTHASSDSISLGYSDGTAAGTWFVKDLGPGSFDLSTAVGLRAAGTEMPADSTAPTLLRATVNTDKLTLFFSDSSALDSAHPASAADFSLSGTSASIESIAVDGAAKTVTLSLSASVLSTDVVRISYIDPSPGNDVSALQDASGNDAASFTNRFVVNQTADNIAPVFQSAVVNGDTLTLTYSDTGLLDAVNTPSASAFSLTGTDATVSTVSVDGAARTVKLILSKALIGADTIALSYTDPTSGNDAGVIQDAAGNDAASFVGTPVTNLTPVKAPWTLLLPSSSGLFASDGTAGATGYKATTFSYKLLTNADQTRAVWFTNEQDPLTQILDFPAYGIADAQGSPVLLARGVGAYANGTPYILGNSLVFSHNPAEPSLITDGTQAGTAFSDLPWAGVVDTANAVVWGQRTSAPYGTELFRAVFSAEGLSTTMVEDIFPGASSGYTGGGALLSNGKFVFTGNDGTSGSEPWVSDGTAAGTFRLADLGGSKSGNPGQFVTLGDKVVFVANVDRLPDGTPSALGQELVVTDGTAAGTLVFDVNPGSSSSNPSVLGHVGNVLYFSANFSAAGRAIYSTDGTSFTRLSEISSNWPLLGLDAAHAFFRVSDSAHGDELWAADLVTGGYGLVKDILPGSGSALAGDSKAFMADGKLVFQAYTSATQQSLFVSDGTEAGTLQLAGLASGCKLIGDHLVFADGGIVYTYAIAATVPDKQQLASAPGSVAGIQSDADQAFFTTSVGDLYASDGTIAGTIKIASSVAGFKVVAEDALYLVLNNPSSSTAYGLAYSDGTVAGTRYVEDAPASILAYIDQAIAIKTVGVPQALPLP